MPLPEIPITLDELAASLPDIVGRVRERGERFVVLDDDKRVAVLAPPTAPARHQVTMADFLEHIKDLPPLDEDYEKDIEDALAILLPPDPSEWE